MSTEKTFQQKLNEIQVSLNAPKSQYNAFGKYRYRSCEDILTALKPLLKEQGLTLTISDEIVFIGNRFYVKATSTLSDGKESVSTTAYAREEESKKGMDGSQVTGAASSYSRKYSLNGLFAIDDTKDADATNTHGQLQNTQQLPPLQPQDINTALKSINDAKSIKELTAVYNKFTTLQTNKDFMNALSAKKKIINGAA